MNLRIDQLDRKANPQRYSLSSGAELIHHFIPNYNKPSLHIWTQVGNEKYDSIKHVDWLNPIWESFTKDEATIYELINDVFEPQEQVNEAQANLLGVAFELAAGGQAQVHVGTGSGGSSSELPWGEQKTKTHSNADKLPLPSYNLIHNFLLLGTATPQINTSGFNAFMPHQVGK